MQKCTKCWGNPKEKADGLKFTKNTNHKKDQRVDTTKKDTTEIRHLSLCTGYGGIDLGLHRVLSNCRTVTYVEIEAFAIRNLVAKMETGLLDTAPIWTDVKTMPLGQLREVLGRESIISGGFPCQPFSLAGQNKADQDPRHLWPFIKDAIRVIQPRWVFLENVEGLVSSKLKGDNWSDPEGTPVLLHVLRELERLGYQSEAGIFSAEEVGLPHQRRRVFILAHNNCFRGEVPNKREITTKQIIKRHGKEGRVGVTPARPGNQQHWWEPSRVINTELGNSSDTGLRELVHESCKEGKEEGGHPGGASDPTVTIRSLESSVDGSSHGTTRRMGYAELCQSVDNRNSELMALGNGVVPATAAKAFLTLWKRLQ